MSIARKALIVFLSFSLFLSFSGVGLCYTAGRTVLQPEFVISQMEGLDVTALSKDLIREQVPPEIESMLSEEYISGLIDEVVADLEPWIREQVADAVDEGYDYILGKSQELIVTVDLGTVKPILRDSLWQVISKSPPSWLAMLPRSEMESIYYTLYDDLSAGLPDTLEIDEAILNSLDPEMVPLLEKARQYVRYYRILYSILIVATAALIAGIIVLNRRSVKGSTLWLGIPCLVCGILAFLSSYIVKRLAVPIILRGGLPTQLEDWLGEFLVDSVAPLTTYGIAMMIAGAALLITSIVYRRRQLSNGTWC